MTKRGMSFRAELWSIRAKSIVRGKFLRYNFTCR
nr:MAG TPA: hypothetical protein [Bacteriophage sp.]